MRARSLMIPFLLSGLVLAGCARPMQRDTPPPLDSSDIESTTTGGVGTTAPPATTPRPTPKPRTRPQPQPPAGEEELPVTPSEPEREDTGAVRPAGSLTGVPVCDNYLANYKRCHGTIGQSAPAQVEERYQRIRESLVGQSGTPEGRAKISATCKQFADLVVESLAGRECGDPPR